MKRVLIIASNQSKLANSDEKTGVWLSDLTYPYYALREEGCQIDIASPKGAYVPLDPRSTNIDSAPPNVKYRTDRELLDMMEHSIPLDEIRSRNYDCVIIPGGHGALYDLPHNYDAKKIIKEVYEAGGVIGAISHGVSVLTDVKLSDGRYLVEGKKLTSVTNSEEESTDLHKFIPLMTESKLVDRKAIYHKCNEWEECVMEDGRLITAQNPESAQRFSSALSSSLISHYILV